MISSKLDPLLYNARSCRGGFYKQSMPEIDRLKNPPPQGARIILNRTKAKKTRFLRKIWFGDEKSVNKPGF